MDTTWKAIVWQQREFGPVIRLMTSPFYEGERFVVYVNDGDTTSFLNTKGEWEWHPMPSSRTDAFYERCRFKSFEEAVKALDMP